jgi:hypothetical protein
MNHIDRRTFLRGVGTAVALPVLERMLPMTALATTPKEAKQVRMAFMFVPNGVNMKEWTPAAEGVIDALPSILEPLAPVKNSINVLTGLSQFHAEANGDGPGDHARSTACFLTGVQPKKTSGADIHAGISVDQVAAMHIGNQTKFASLELGCEGGGVNGDCDSGYSCAYSSSISWRSAETPVAKETNPRLVFDRLFGNENPDETRESRTRRNLLKQSLLDFVSDDAARLKGQLGLRDRRKLDEYFQGIREIEERLLKFESTQAERVAAGVVRPNGVPADYGEHIRLMTDMMILAFQADLTRVSTMMFANDGSNRSYAQIGVPEGHHDMSHHGGNPVKLEKKRKIDHYHVEQLAYALKKMASIKELDGSLLDNSLIVYGAGISDGNRHNHDNLPILLAGHGGFGMPSGRHVVYQDHTPLNNLFVSMLDRVGVNVDKLGDSTGDLKGLF